MHPVGIYGYVDNGGDSMTVEASYIFSFFTILVVSLIRLDFYFHNNMLSDTSLVIAGLQYTQAQYYYAKNGALDKESIANSPIFGENRDFAATEKGRLQREVEVYYGEKKLGKEGVLSDTDFADVIAINDNANLVRSGGRLIQVIGGSDGS